MISKFLKILADTSDEGMQRINSMMQIVLICFVIVAAAVGLISYAVDMLPLDTAAVATAEPIETHIEASSSDEADRILENSTIELTSTNSLNTSDEATQQCTYNPCTYVESGDIYLTEDEVYTLATLVFLEASTESYFTKKCVASVVLNRMYTSGQSLEDVIYATNQFEPAEYIPYYEPTDECVEAVYAVLSERASVPVWVQYFRTDYYHDWSDQIEPFIQVDNTYFSYDTEIMSMYKKGDT